ncbi:hypothetical protein EMPG_16646 [Blastomyces silverae]|uniref:Uncharacterized protein n=1 Tax=Blastomyces silverae TaxID=2060906 RepID=A0A0H1B8V2_9EURO|nr:hypothetical protein EMPG_16646 [Blastomyces silverae]
MSRPRKEVVFFRGAWLETYDPYYGEDFRKQMAVDDKAVVIEILEYYYGDEHNRLVHHFFRETHALILTLDVTSREQLDLIQQTHAAFLSFMRRYGSTPCVFPSWPIYKASSKDEATQPQTFTCFPRLPQELQIAVLREALTCPDPVPLPMPHVAGINLNILKACKLFYEEGSRIFWKENTFLPLKPMTLVAETGWVTPSKPRAVTTEEGQKLARRLGCKYVELSSRYNEPVVDVVADLVREHRAVVAAAPDEFDGASEARGIINLTPNYRVGLWLRMSNRRHSREALRSLVRSFKRRASRIFVTK